MAMEFFMRWFSALVFSLVLAGSASAEELAPDALVRNVATDVLDLVRKDKEIQNGNTRKAADLVEKMVLPHFNFKRMTAQAVGKWWRQATPVQQQALQDEFRTLLVRTYANALTAYKNQTIEFKPLKMAPADKDVMVRTEVRQPGAKSINIDYAMQKTPDGWKVYDFSIGGISMVTSYRDQFGPEIGNNGLDGLLRTLKAKNAAQGGATAAKS